MLTLAGSLVRDQNEARAGIAVVMLSTTPVRAYPIPSEEEDVTRTCPGQPPRMGVLAAATLLAAAPAAVADFCERDGLVTAPVLPQSLDTGGEGPLELEVIDLDEDGQLDLVYLAGNGTAFQANRALVQYGIGPMTFGSPELLFDGEEVRSLQIADLDGDGILDLGFAVLGPSNPLNLVSVTFAADRSFQVITTDVPGFAAPNGLGFGDLTGNGVVDALLQSGTQVRVLSGVGDGTFIDDGTTFSAPSGDGLILGDLDGDDDLDVVVAGNTRYRAFLNDGTGSFSGSPTVNEFANSVDLMDLDDDGILDLVTTQQNTSVLVHLGDGDGTFAPPVLLPVEFGPESTGISFGDVDHDGRSDLAFTNRNSQDVTIVRDPLASSPSIERYRFAPPTSTPNARFSNPVIVDLNGDGNMDIMTGSLNPAQVSVTLGQGGGMFEGDRSYGPRSPNGVSPIAIGPSSIPGVVVRRSFGNLVLLEDDGAGGLVSRGEIPSSFSVFTDSIPSADLDGDGAADLVANRSSSLVAWFGIGIGGEGSTPPVVIAASIQAGIPFIVDIDGENGLDIMVLSAGFAGDALTFLNQGDGTFEDGPVLDVPSSSFVNPVVGDFNGDGLIDVAALDFSVSGVVVRLGNGDGSFADGVASTVNGRPLKAFDLDNDGLDDLIVRASGFAFESALSGPGGTLGASIPMPLPPGFAAGIACADFDHDGSVDVLAFENLAPINIAFGAGDGSFIESIEYPIEPGRLVVIDLDGDDRGELVSTGFANISIASTQCDDDDPDPDPICGDINEDLVVDMQDVLLVLTDFGVCVGCATDLNGDGVTGLFDLVTVLGCWTAP